MIMTATDFRLRMRDIAGTFRYTAPDAFWHTWADLVAPLLAQAAASAPDVELDKELARADAVVKFRGTHEACEEWIRSFE